MYPYKMRTMTRSNLSNPTTKPRMGSARRKAMSLSQTDLVTINPLDPSRPLPYVIQPAITDLNLVSWAASHRDLITQHLRRVGGILFRNFQIKGTTDFEQFVQTVAGRLLHYSFGSTPRTQVQGQIYTSTEYPASEVIPLHNEMAYTRNWPMKIAFFCVQPAESGGVTPIADSRRIFQRLEPTLRDHLRDQQIMYIRNYGSGLDLSWQQVFQTHDKTDVEAYCQKEGIEWEWQDDCLTTRQVCQAIATHPQTGEAVWFNQAHLFHISNLKPTIREALSLGEVFPRNAYYGNGDEIELAVLDAIRQAYASETIEFTWQAGDVLLLDNMLVAHGRMPFKGDRKMLVGMAEPGS